MYLRLSSTKRIADFGDPLFVKVPAGVIPTPTAERLYPDLARVMEDLTKLFQEPNEFDPMKAEGRVHLATTDYFEQSIAPSLIGRLAKEAPGVTVVCRPLAGVLPKEDLANGTMGALRAYRRGSGITCRSKNIPRLSNSMASS